MKTSHLALGNLSKMVFWSFFLFKNGSFANCAAFSSSRLCVSFSHERTSERVERKFYSQNPTLRHSLPMVYHLWTSFKLYWLWLHHLQKERKRVFSALISLQVSDQILAHVTCNSFSPHLKIIYYVHKWGEGGA